MQHFAQPLKVLVCYTIHPQLGRFAHQPALEKETQLSSSYVLMQPQMILAA